jgi:hypothetical protein
LIRVAFQVEQHVHRAQDGVDMVNAQAPYEYVLQVWV